MPVRSPAPQKSRRDFTTLEIHGHFGARIALEPCALLQLLRGGYRSLPGERSADFTRADEPRLDAQRAFDEYRAAATRGNILARLRW